MDDFLCDGCHEYFPYDECFGLDEDDGEYCAFCCEEKGLSDE